MDNCMDPGFQESLLSAFWFVNSALPVKFECVRSKISQFCCAVPLLHTSCVPGTSAPLMFACVFLCGLRPPRLHGESPRTRRDRWLCVLPRGRMNVNVNVQDRYTRALGAGDGRVGFAGGGLF